LIYYPIATRSRIVAGKVPVAGVGGATHVQIFDGLINYLYGYNSAGRCYQLGNFIGYLFRCKGLIQLPHHILRMQLIVTLQLVDAIGDLLEYMFLIGILQQGNRRPKSNKVAQLTHINSITIWITDLGGRRNYYNFFRI